MKYCELSVIHLISLLAYLGALLDQGLEKSHGTKGDAKPGNLPLNCQDVESSADRWEQIHTDMLYLCTILVVTTSS